MATPGTGTNRLPQASCLSSESGKQIVGREPWVGRRSGATLSPAACRVRLGEAVFSRLEVDIKTGPGTVAAA